MYGLGQWVNPFLSWILLNSASSNSWNNFFWLFWVWLWCLIFPWDGSTSTSSFEASNHRVNPEKYFYQKSAGCYRCLESDRATEKRPVYRGKRPTRWKRFIDPLNCWTKLFTWLKSKIDPCTRIKPSDVVKQIGLPQKLIKSKKRFLSREDRDFVPTFNIFSMNFWQSYRWRMEKERAIFSPLDISKNLSWQSFF